MILFKWKSGIREDKLRNYYIKLNIVVTSNVKKN